MEEDVPLLIPEVNADHLGWIEKHRKKRGWEGAIVQTPTVAQQYSLFRSSQ
jgi:aspartate-semialdehyde dehydrogenase